MLNFPGGSDYKASDCHVGDLGSISWFGRSPAEGNGYPLQYSCGVGYNSRGRRKSDTTNRLTYTHRHMPGVVDILLVSTSV